MRVFYLYLLSLLLAILFFGCQKPDEGCQYGNTSNPQIIHNAVTDIDGNTYDAVKIGNQTWMASNLITTRYANGERISEYYYYPSFTDPTYYNANSLDGLGPACGFLYNWPAVMHGAHSSNRNPSGVKGICPNGWHVPSEKEWTQLIDYCENHSEYVCCPKDFDDANNIAKALAYDHGWKESDPDDEGVWFSKCNVGYKQHTNNVTGFSALPMGRFYFYNCFSDYLRYRDDYGYQAFFWCSTAKTEDSNSALAFHINCDCTDVYYGSESRRDMFSVRCVKD